MLTVENKIKIFIEIYKVNSGYYSGKLLVVTCRQLPSIKKILIFFYFFFFLNFSKKKFLFL